MSNPLTGTQYKELMARLQREGEREDRLKESALRAAAASGDVKLLNKHLSLYASGNDAMAHVATGGRLLNDAAVDPDRLPARSVKGAGILSRDNESWANTGALTGGGEVEEKQRILRYLNAKASLGKLSKKARKMARMWAENVTQEDIARQLAVKQPWVSKVLARVRQQANASNWA